MASVHPVRGLYASTTTIAPAESSHSRQNSANLATNNRTRIRNVRRQRATEMGSYDHSSQASGHIHSPSTTWSIPIRFDSPYCSSTTRGIDDNFDMEAACSPWTPDARPTSILWTPSSWFETALQRRARDPAAPSSRNYSIKPHSLLPGFLVRFVCFFLFAYYLSQYY